MCRIFVVRADEGHRWWHPIGIVEAGQLNKWNIHALGALRGLETRVPNDLKSLRERSDLVVDEPCRIEVVGDVTSEFVCQVPLGLRACMQHPDVLEKLSKTTAPQFFFDILPGFRVSITLRLWQRSDDLRLQNVGG